MKPTNPDEKAMRKPSGGAWVLAGVFILMGAYELWMYIAQGYISITPGATHPGVHYTGPVAIAVIMVCFGVGFIGLRSAFRAWSSYRRSR